MVNICEFCGSKYDVILLCNECNLYLCKNEIQSNVNTGIDCKEDCHFDNCKVLNSMTNISKKERIGLCVYCRDDIGSKKCEKCQIIMCNSCFKYPNQFKHYSNCEYFKNS